MSALTTTTATTAQPQTTTPGAPTTLPAALLLDMDDTILADSAGLKEAYRLVYERYADRFAPASVAALTAAKDDYSDWYWSDPERHRLGRLDLNGARQIILAESLRRLGVFDEAGAAAADMREALAQEMAGAYGEQRLASSRPLPGAIEALTQLRAGGCGWR